MKKIMFIFLLLLIIAGCKVEKQVCFDDTCFSAEVVDTYEERQKGLMFRESLEQDAGMLFVFAEKGVYSFWMKNTLIPLDMLWINEDMEVVFIARNVPPCEADPCPTVNPNTLATYVFEINAGLVDYYTIRPGSKVELKNI